MRSGAELRQDAGRSPGFLTEIGPSNRIARMLKMLTGRFKPLTLQGDLPSLSSFSPPLSDFTGVILSRNEPEVWILFVEGEAVRALRYNLESSLFKGLPSASPLDEAITLLDGAGGKAAYPTDPVFLKILLIIAEQRPSLFGSSAFVDVEKLVLAVERGRRDALLLVEQGEEWALFLFYGGKVIEGYAAENGSPGRDGIFNLVYRGDETPCRIIFYDLVLPRPGRASEEGKGEEGKDGTRGPALLMEGGTGSGASFPLAGGRIVIGRENGDLRLDDARISRVHAEVMREGDAFFISDLGSTNGTFLNGERVERAALKGGDVICVGETLLRFIA